MQALFIFDEKIIVPSAISHYREQEGITTRTYECIVFSYHDKNNC